MNQPHVQRKLAASLAAVVTGYSRLMGGDEEGKLVAITAQFTELIEPCIADSWSRRRVWTARGICQRGRCRV